MNDPDMPWSVAVRLIDIGESGRHVEIEADAATREALAGALGVDAVQAAAATFDLVPSAHNGVHVEGRVRATVRQSCVVTLEPVVNEIREAIEVDFAPPEKASAGRPKSEDEAPSSIEGPEPLEGDSIDVGALATECLILGVDPYPRKPGVSFETSAGTDEPKAGPFAALGALKKGTVKE